MRAEGLEEYFEGLLLGRLLVSCIGLRQPLFPFAGSKAMRITVAAQFPNCTGFQLKLLTLVVYQLRRTLHIRFVYFTMLRS